MNQVDLSHAAIHCIRFELKIRNSDGSLSNINSPIPDLSIAEPVSLPEPAWSNALGTLESTLHRYGFESDLLVTYTGGTMLLLVEVLLHRMEWTNGAYQQADTALRSWIGGPGQEFVDAVGAQRQRTVSSIRIQGSLAESSAQNELDLALDDAMRLLKLAARWLPSEIRADEIETAFDYLYENATTADQAVSLARWLGWKMVAMALMNQCQGQTGLVAAGAIKWAASGLGLVASAKEVWSLPLDNIAAVGIIIGAGVIGGAHAVAGRQRKRPQD